MRRARFVQSVHQQPNTPMFQEMNSRAIKTAVGIDPGLFPVPP
jgi:hypothetical protein